MRRLSLLSCFTPHHRGIDEDGALLFSQEKASCTAEPSPAASAAQATSLSNEDPTRTDSSCDPSVGSPPKDTCQGNCPALKNCSNFEALPFSWAILTSDARNILHHHLGQEPAAAKICSQALQSVSSSSSSSSPPCLSASGTQHGTHPASNGTSSFLAALLGPQLEAAALKRTKMGRPWKGTICMQLPATGHPSDSSAHFSVHISPTTSAALEEEMQRARGVETHTSTRENPGIPLKAPRQHSKGSIRFQDEEYSYKGIEESPKGAQEQLVLSQQFPGQLERKGIFDHLHERFEGDYELQHASRGAVGAQTSKELPRSPFYDSAKLRPPLDCSARLDSGIHAGEKDGQTKLGRNVSVAQSSSLRRQRLRRGHSNPGLDSNSRKGSLQMSEKEVERFLSEGMREASTSSRTKAFLKSLSRAEVENHAEQKVCMPYLDKVEHTAKQGRSHSALDRCAILEAEIESLDKNSGSRDTTERLPRPQLGSVGSLTMHGFDVTVSLLDHTEGKRSPLMVMISDSTEHLKVREVLTALAESQLELLANIMPQHAIQFLATESSEAVPEHVGQLARAHKSATLMFMDICGFTAMSKEVEPVQVMVFLNTLFSHFDKLVDIHGVHKVETAGDCYIVSGGIMKQAVEGFGQSVEESHDPEESARRVMEFAKAILDVAGQVEMPNTQQPVRIRIGMHTGDVVSGMIGTKLPKFSVFGDTMNTASRMESTGVPGRIHVSEVTRKLLSHEEWEPTGGVEVKGKGKMESYLWIPQLMKCSSDLHIDASSSHTPLARQKSAQQLLSGHILPLSRQRSAQQPLSGHILPLPALCPAIHLFHSSRSTHAVMSHDVPKEWERGWETNNSFDSHNKSSGQQCLNAMASISSSMITSKVLKATQSLSLLKRRGILLPASSPQTPVHLTRRPEGSLVAFQQGCATMATVGHERASNPQELGAS